MNHTCLALFLTKHFLILPLRGSYKTGGSEGVISVLLVAWEWDSGRELRAPGGSAACREGPVPPRPRPAPTCGSRVARRRLARPPGLVLAHPLLAAAAGQAHAPRAAAPEARGARAQAQRRAAHRAVHARAVVLAVGLEGLAVVVARSVQDAAHADHLCEHSAAGSGPWRSWRDNAQTPGISHHGGGAGTARAKAGAASDGELVGLEQSEGTYVPL